MHMFVPMRADLRAGHGCRQACRTCAWDMRESMRADPCMDMHVHGMHAKGVW